MNIQGLFTLLLTMLAAITVLLIFTSPARRKAAWPGLKILLDHVCSCTLLYLCALHFLTANDATDNASLLRD